MGKLLWGLVGSGRRSPAGSYQALEIFIVCPRGCRAPAQLRAPYRSPCSSSVRSHSSRHRGSPSTHGPRGRCLSTPAAGSLPSKDGQQVWGWRRGLRLLLSPVLKRKKPKGDPERLRSCATRPRQGVMLGPGDALWGEEGCGVHPQSPLWHPRPDAGGGDPSTPILRALLSPQGLLPPARESPGPPGAAMEGASVLSPSSWEKRRAWVRQSRCWRTTVVEEEAAAAMQDVPELQPPHLDDVFLEGLGRAGRRAHAPTGNLRAGLARERPLACVRRRL